MDIEKMRQTMSEREFAYRYLCKRFKILTQPNDKIYLYRIIDACGVGFAWKIFNQVRKIEAAGGMMTNDGTRRRTAFGIFCHLATKQMTPQHQLRLRTPFLQLRALDAAQKMVRKIRWAIAQAEGPVISAAAIAEQDVVAEPEIIAVVQAPAPSAQMTARKPESKKQNNGKAARRPAYNKREFAASRQARFQNAPAPADPLDGLPPAVKAKLQQLQGAANVLRERVQQLESKPAGQQVGLEMARKLLASNESQIAALLAEHERSGEVAS